MQCPNFLLNGYNQDPNGTDKPAADGRKNSPSVSFGKCQSLGYIHTPNKHVLRSIRSKDIRLTPKACLFSKKLALARACLPFHLNLNKVKRATDM
jgi:hypothetical protein